MKLITILLLFVATNCFSQQKKIQYEFYCYKTFNDFSEIVGDSCIFEDGYFVFDSNNQKVYNNFNNQHIEYKIIDVEWQETIYYNLIDENNKNYVISHDDFVGGMLRIGGLDDENITIHEYVIKCIN